MEPQKRILIQTGVALFAIGLTVFAPDFAHQSRYVVLALVILLIGMPHGALDHHIDGNLEKWNPYSFNKKFYGWYLSAIAVYSVLWIFFPLFSFLFFLLITLYHFGQADAERFSYEGWRKWAIHLGRGFTVVGLIVFGDLEYASSVIEAVTGFSVQLFLADLFPISLLTWTIASSYLAVFLLVNLNNKHRTKHFGVYLIDAIIVPLLFLYADVVWAFAIYFGLWHSYNHVLVMLKYLSDQTTERSFGWFFKESFVFSLLTYLGLLFVYNMLDAFGNEELLVSLLFVVISVLTLPHMMVVEKLYARLNR